MINIDKIAKKYNLFDEGDIVGVACSGGMDSICLLHYLNENKEKFGIEIMAINVDHKIRENSEKDSAFVMSFCRKNGIKCQKFVVDALNVAKEQKLTIEEAARVARYGVFDALLDKKIVNKIAIAHHSQDQTETILLNLFRGTGLKGARGMEVKRGGYIRPFLFTPKEEIIQYVHDNNLDYVEDETNRDDKYSRNFIRNEIIPMLKTHWSNVESNILSFSNICKQDDEFISKQVDFDRLIIEKDLVKIPLSYFVYDAPIVYRVLRRSFENLLTVKDMERKHMEMVRSLALEGENGTKISLPNGITCHKEYDFITISIVRPKLPMNPIKFRFGTIDIENYGKVSIKKTDDLSIVAGELKIDLEKLPKDCIIRNREDGDIFTPYGNGTKKLKDYFIDKKVPARIRNDIPVLAYKNEIMVVFGMEISDDVKVDKDTLHAVSFKKLDK